MKFVILACVAALASAAPQYSYSAPTTQPPARVYGPPVVRVQPQPPSRASLSPAAPTTTTTHIPIIKDNRDHQDDGSYTLDVQTGNDIFHTEAGDEDGNKAGVIRYTQPDGSLFELKYVASANGGFQVQSDQLPKAPAFPHPIPDFVLEQIRRAEIEDAEAARQAALKAAEDDDDDDDNVVRYRYHDSDESDSDEDSDSDEHDDSDEEGYHIPQPSTLYGAPI